MWLAPFATSRNSSGRQGACAVAWTSGSLVHFLVRHSWVLCPVSGEEFPSGTIPPAGGGGGDPVPPPTVERENQRRPGCGGGRGGGVVEAAPAATADEAVAEPGIKRCYGVTRVSRM